MCIRDSVSLSVGCGQCDGHRPALKERQKKAHPPGLHVDVYKRQVYFMTSGPNLVGELFAVDIASHQARWSYEMSTESYSAPSLAGDLLVWGGRCV